MKAKQLFLVLGLSMACSLIIAQSPSQPKTKQGERKQLTPEMRVNHLAEKLELSEVQKAQILELFKQQDVKAKEIRGKMQKQRVEKQPLSEEQKANMKAEFKAFNEKMATILGAEKFKKYEAMRGENFQKAKGKIKHHQAAKREKFKQHAKEAYTPEKRVAKMKETLQLTDAEASALVEVLKKQEARMKADREQIIEKMKKQNDAEIEKVIGKEKMAKLNELKAKHQKK